MMFQSLKYAIATTLFLLVYFLPGVGDVALGPGRQEAHVLGTALVVVERSLVARQAAAVRFVVLDGLKQD